MIDLYYWPTPNGCKVSILLHELEQPYRLIPLDIGKGDQFSPEFLHINPNGRMPAIVDSEATGGGTVSLFESGAIMMYLAEKHARFWPQGLFEKYEVVKWLMWQMSGLGPMCGQAHHFRQYAPEPIPYAIKRYTDEVNRLYGVMEGRLRDRSFLADEYSIADIASWCWVKPWKLQGQQLDEFPHLKDWFERIGLRPHVRSGWKVGREWLNHGPVVTEESKAVLFGQRARRE